MDAEGLASRDAGVTTRHALAVAFPRELADTAAEPPLDVGLFLDRVRSYVDVEPTLERSQPAALEEVAELGRRSRHSRATSRSPVGSRPAESTS